MKTKASKKDLTEFRTLSEDDLNQRLKTAKEELFKLRFQLAIRQLDNTSQIGEVRHRSDSRELLRHLGLALGIAGHHSHQLDRRSGGDQRSVEDPPARAVSGQGPANGGLGHRLIVPGGPGSHSGGGLNRAIDPALNPGLRAAARREASDLRRRVAVGGSTYHWES